MSNLTHNIATQKAAEAELASMIGTPLLGPELPAVETRQLETPFLDARLAAEEAELKRMFTLEELL